jgi:DNA-binding MarR family transcriptional regulator
MKSTEKVCFNIKTAWHGINRKYADEAGVDGSSTSILFALLTIDAKNGTPSTHIGPLLGLEPTSLTRIIKTMDTQKLIEKYSDPNDGRVTRIKLTKKGIEAKDKALKVVNKFNNEVKKKVSAKDLETFFNVLGEIQKLAGVATEISSK